MKLSRFGVAAAALVFFGCQPAAEKQGQVREYFIAADEVEWDYAPHDRNMLFDRAWSEEDLRAVQAGDYRAGKLFKKAIYREYTDATFTTLKPRPPEWEHLGILGPLLRAEVGDTIKITFRNNASHPFTMHPHGVFYEKKSEGALYNDGSESEDKADDGVAPGATHVYLWEVPERAGPPPGGSSSAFWMYHSHHEEELDFNAGLVGPMIVTARGSSGDGLRPVDVDREFVVALMSIEEGSSHYFEENIRTYAGKADEIRFVPGLFTLKAAVGPDGAPYSPFLENINGYLFGNGPRMVAKKGERVRWYVMAGTGFEVHAPHWHGNVGIEGDMHTDVLELTTMGMHILDMVPDAEGTWLFHCHVANHFRSGMGTLYEVVE